MQTITNDSLISRYGEYREKNPRSYLRDAAEALGASEAELLAAGASGRVRALALTPAELLRHLPALGAVKTITRNHAAVIEKWGSYNEPELVSDTMGQVVGADIDLRLFLQHWRHIYLLEQERGDDVRHSVQVFDGSGASVHKIYREPETDAAAWSWLDDRAEPASMPAVEPAKQRPASQPLEDASVLHREWDALRDTHEFFVMLRKLGLRRVDALRAAGPVRARPVAIDSVEPVLQACVELDQPMMAFVGSRGVIQIHTGAIRKVVRMHGWLNILDPGFNLHLRDELVHSAWVVRKPTSDGIVTSLELYDADEELVCQFFGERKPGRAEAEAWRTALERVKDAELSNGGRGEA